MSQNPKRSVTERRDNQNPKRSVTKRREDQNPKRSVTERRDNKSATRRKTCPKCGASDFGANGKCKPCRRAYMVAHRAKQYGDTPPANHAGGRPPKKMKFTPRPTAPPLSGADTPVRDPSDPPDQPDSSIASTPSIPSTASTHTAPDPDLSSLETAADRLRFMQDRHTKDITDIDDQINELDQRIADAEKEELAKTALEYRKLRAGLAAKRADLNLSISKALAVWQEYAEKEIKQLPVRFVYQEIPAPPGLIVPSQADKIDFSKF